VRRLLAVLVLMISSVLLLQAPAWAPHLYEVDRTDGDGGTNASWTAYIDCSPGSRAQITSGRFMSSVTAIVQGSDDPRYAGKVGYLTRMRPGFVTAPQPGVTCTLPQTGSRVFQQLALGIGLLLLGGLFVMLSAHPSVRRRMSHPDRRTAD
jgi:LPXTG-motif cell wall-anchored protein